jgi:hypothetical protein
MPKSAAAVLDEHVPLLERALVEQQLEPFPRAELALGMLRGDACLAAAQARRGALAFQLFDDVVHQVFSLESIRSSRRRAATEAANMPARTSSVICGSASRTAGWWRKRCVQPASMRSHIQARSCSWRRASQPAGGLLGVAEGHHGAQKPATPGGLQRAELQHLRAGMRMGAQQAQRAGDLRRARVAARRRGRPC